MATVTLDGVRKSYGPVDMAIRLSKAFGSSPETWLGMQTAHDLWQARDRMRAIKVRQFKAA